MMETPTFRYLILGAGRQGTAAAYDLVRFGQARAITLADADLQTAQQAAARVNELVEQPVAQAQAINVLDPAALAAALQAHDAAISAVPYKFNLEITRAAIAAGCHLADLGGNTEIVRAQYKLHAAAVEAGVSVVPDTGMGPGLVNTLGAYAMALLDEPQEIYIYDAGLPQRPEPPWNYALTFDINGLTNEMDGQAVFLRAGKVTYVETLSEPEEMFFEPLGRLEADVTSGGVSLAPWNYAGQLQIYENKVMRYPGHFEWLRAFKTLGLFSEAPFQVGDQTVIPRQVYHALLAPQISAPGPVEDIGIFRVIGKGKKAGQAATVTIELVDYYDPQTGFTAMERLTGWHSAIMLIFQARGRVEPGVQPVELAVPPAEFLAALEQRGIGHSVVWS